MKTKFVNLLKRIAYRYLWKIFPYYPHILKNELGAVKSVLRSPKWNMGYGHDLVHHKLEQEFAESCGRRFAVATGTCGMAIQLTLRGLGIKPGDEVIHQVDTCSADALAVMSTGAAPIFADINLNTLGMDLNNIEFYFSSKTKAILGIHLWGIPENIPELKKMANKMNIPLIEDCALAFGGTFSSGASLGSFGYASVYSFGTIKPLQAGEGGMITTDDPILARELRILRAYGDEGAVGQARNVKIPGWNGRMSEIVAAVALEQLRGHHREFKRIRENALIFAEIVKDRTGYIPAAPEKMGELMDLTLVPPDFSRTPRTSSKYVSADLVEKLQKAKIPCFHAHFEPITTLELFKNKNWQKWLPGADFSNVDRNYSQEFRNAKYLHTSGGLTIFKTNFLTKSKAQNVAKIFSELVMSKK